MRIMKPLHFSCAKIVQRMRSYTAAYVTLIKTAHKGRILLKHVKVEFCFSIQVVFAQN